MQAPRIIVDKRERNLEVIDGLGSSGTKLEFAQLPVGDYILSGRICVERKTVSDFENSIMDNRLFEQLDRLRSSFERPMLIIEGSEAEYRLGKNIIMGTMLKLYADYGIQIMKSADAVETAEMLSKLAVREQNREGNMPRITGIKKAYTTYQWQTLILGSMPGIGPAIAHRLIAHFRTLKNVANADRKQLMKVDKIGSRKADAIYNLLNAEFGTGDK